MTHKKHDILILEQFLTREELLSYENQNKYGLNAVRLKNVKQCRVSVILDDKA